MYCKFHMFVLFPFMLGVCTAAFSVCTKDAILSVLSLYSTQASSFCSAKVTPTTSTTITPLPTTINIIGTTIYTTQTREELIVSAIVTTQTLYTTILTTQTSTISTNGPGSISEELSIISTVTDDTTITLTLSTTTPIISPSPSLPALAPRHPHHRPQARSPVGDSNPPLAPALAAAAPSPLNTLLTSYIASQITSACTCFASALSTSTKTLTASASRVTYTGYEEILSVVDTTLYSAVTLTSTVVVEEMSTLVTDVPFVVFGTDTVQGTVTEVQTVEVTVGEAAATGSV